MASSLGKVLVEKGHHPLGVYSRNPISGSKLAEELQTAMLTDFASVKEPDLVFLCVADSQIKSVAQSLPNWENAIICHCSGATDLSEISAIVNKAGVFYPMQSFIKEKKTHWNEVPILIEGSNNEIVSHLIEVANSLSARVSECNSRKRLQYHLAAVIINNFTNHLIALSQEFCNKNNLDFSNLNPLLNETLKRAQSGNAKEMQTGPAIRNDQNSLKKHLQLLSEYPELSEVYLTLTKSIQKMGK